jgi:Disulphide bond corrector protein DsbC
VLNGEATGQFLSMARPGYFFIDTRGVIREKFFEAKYRERLSGNNLIAKLFPELGDEVTNTIEAPHIQLTINQSDHIAFPGNRITLTAEVKLPPDVHVYAPGTKGYRPTLLTINPVRGAQIKSSVYPRSKILYLPAIKEHVPVFEGTFRIREDLQVSAAADFSNALSVEGKTLEITGKFEYQACDSKICFVPSSVPLHWQLQVFPLDRQRAPEAVQHK